jgi:polyribonucleotide nucleotidyltransferase
MIDGQYVLNPTLAQLDEGLSSLELTVAATSDAVLMVEAAANELSEDEMVGAIEFAQRELQGVIDLIARMRDEIGLEKRSFASAADVSHDDVDDMRRAAMDAGLTDALRVKGKHERSVAVKDLRDRLIAERVTDQEAEGASERTEELKSAFRKVEQAEMRRMVIEERIRSDGRGPADVRDIWIETGVLPMAHGSAIFTRGETQVLGTATLGTGRDNRLVDDLGLEKSEEFMLHYNFPPYTATWRAGRSSRSSPRRRTSRT